MTLAYMGKLGLQIKPINVGASKIDNPILKMFLKMFSLVFRPK